LFNWCFRSVGTFGIFKFALAALQPRIVTPALPPKPDVSGHEIKRDSGANSRLKHSFCFSNHLYQIERQALSKLNALRNALNAKLPSYRNRRFFKLHIKTNLYKFAKIY